MHAPSKTALYSIAITTDGKTSAVGGYNDIIYIYDLPGKSLLAKLTGHTNFITYVQFTCDDKHVVSNSRDGTIKKWDVAAGACVQTIADVDDDGNIYRIVTFAMTQDSSLIFTDGYPYGLIKMWDFTTGQMLASFAGHNAHVVSILAYTHGVVLRMLSGAEDRLIKLWNVDCRACEKTYQGHSGTVTSFTLSNDFASFFSSSVDNTIRYWDIESTSCIRIFRGHRDFVSSILFLSDTSTLVSTSYDGTIKFWNIDNDECETTLQNSSVCEIAFSRCSGTLVSCAGDTINVWHLQLIEMK